MKSRTISVVILGLLLAAVPWRSTAQPGPNPPGQISYQGFLTDANGVPLATNTPVNYNVIFRIFDASTAGNIKWAEQQVVTVDRGYFTVMLGNGIPISGPVGNLTSVFSGTDASDRYLEITVLGLAAGDPPIAPRLRLLASPYSFLANTALNVDGGAVTTGTITDARLSPNVALRAGGNTFSGSQTIVGGNLYFDNGYWIAAKNNLGAYENFLWPRWSDNATYLNYGSGGFYIRNNSSAQTMYLANNGNIGIGNTTPGFPLSFANALGDKISLWGSSGVSYGFGVQANQLQIHTDGSSSDIVFGYGQSANMTETMRITGTGQVGIDTAAPGKALQVGDGNINGSEGMIRLASRSSTGSGAGRTWDIGVPQTGDNTSGVGYSFVVNDGAATDLMVQYGSGNVGIGTISPVAKLDVNGSINANGRLTSPMWGAATIINAVGNQNSGYTVSGTYVSHGGTLILSVSGSGRGGSGSQIGMNVQLDGINIDTCQIYVNTTDHYAFVPRTIVQSGVTVGSHTITLAAISGTVIDVNDKVYVTVQEMPY